MTMDAHNAFVWGIDGELLGNEGRLMACLPFLSMEGSAGVLAARALDWSINPERNLLHIPNEAQALELGEKLALNSPLPAYPGRAVVVFGQGFLRGLSALSRVPESKDVLSWLTRSARRSPDGFYVLCLDSAGYEEIGLRLATIAKTAFDDEISRIRGLAVSPTAEAALTVLKGNPFTKLEELVVRRLIAARIKRDADAYRTTQELAALRLKESPEKIDELVQNHFRILVERSPWEVRPDLAPSLSRPHFINYLVRTQRKAEKGNVTVKVIQGRPMYLRTAYATGEQPLQRQVKTKNMTIARFRAISLGHQVALRNKSRMRLINGDEP